MRKLFLFAVLVLLALHVSAQQRFRAGISFGAVATDIKGADVHTNFRKLGFAAGGIANTKLSDQNELQFEINYITKGSLQPPDSLNNGYHNMSLRYIEVPIVFRRRLDLYIGKRPWPHLELEIGASAGRLIAFKDVVDNYVQYYRIENVNKTDVSLLVGANYRFSDKFYFGLRYSNSIIPALKRNSIPVFMYTRAFNNGNNLVLQLSFHYLFGKSEEPSEVPPPSTPQEQ